jgi:hypothetical protein
MGEDNRYNQKKHATIGTQFSPGEEVHILTQSTKALGRIMNVRVYRVAPSRSGHTGYTKKGFYLTEEEALELRDTLNKLLDEDSISDLFDEPDEQFKPVAETLEEV